MPQINRRTLVRLALGGGRGYNAGMAMFDMMGGFMELELPEHDNFPYREGASCAFVSSGRAALQTLLANLKREPRFVFVPRFVCDTALQPLKRLRLRVRRYNCDDQLRPQLPADLSENDVLILVNYFGLTGGAVEEAARRHPGLSIVDATTALFYRTELPCFYSPRKFCGVADGGVARAPFPLELLPEEEDTSAVRALHLLVRLEEGLEPAASVCDAAEEDLNRGPLLMSPLTRRLLQAYDFESIERRRQENYDALHRRLRGINRLELPDEAPTAPFCYPLASGIPDLRDELVDSGVALPLLWPEVVKSTSAETAENRLARTLLPLPLDQRYSVDDMEELAGLILH